ncbi:11-beta-hydroxysteroid dehydrogenase-like 4A isoform X2 [Malania oleifera]|uniref:11-beta-hydroxysteroid dehydrogenase-like 4A isoform X2 n=1 Tax=Malania oleifera TaxID=397392 RepID=UPI0025ADC6A4|nr:11-beta-hydroxysteroid dehydrogenase-like 4A isoform X2 [Malania oleifera]
MNVIRKLLNVAIPAAMVVALFFFLPSLLFVKFIYSSFRRSNISEDVAGKVVLITGASSGIGEHIAYEYAKRGALLVLTARRKERLREVAEKARKLGSPEVMVVRADVSKADDRERFVDKALHRFGRLDHLVNNAGIAPVHMFEDFALISDLAPVMETNFWGSVHSTHLAIPHLRKSRGKIIVISSMNGRFPLPRMSLYNASKAALISLYETLRVELDGDVGITIVTPWLVNTQGEFLSKLGLAEGVMKFIPVKAADECARAIVESACRGDEYLTLPSQPKTLMKDLNFNLADEKFLKPGH